MSKLRIAPPRSTSLGNHHDRLRRSYPNQVACPGQKTFAESVSLVVVLGDAETRTGRVEAVSAAEPAGGVVGWVVGAVGVAVADLPFAIPANSPDRRGLATSPCC